MRRQAYLDEPITKEDIVMVSVGGTWTHSSKPASSRTASSRSMSATFRIADDPGKVTLNAIHLLVAGAVSGAASRDAAQPETSATVPRH